jgi:hypothetical protein
VRRRSAGHLSIPCCAAHYLTVELRSVMFLTEGPYPIIATFLARRALLI